MDADGDSNAVVDIGAYEYDPNVTEPSFMTDSAAYNVFAGQTFDVEVSITPEAGGAVEAAFTYGSGLSGPATLDILDGAGPVNLPLTAVSTLSGNSQTVAIREGATAQDVQPGEFIVYLYERELTIGGARRFLVLEGNELRIPYR